MTRSFCFERAATDSSGRARTGRVTVRGRSFQTPAFLPVGTAGTVKGVLPRDLAEAGVEILLCNTYHLHLRPGSKSVAALGGLHRFMGWDGAILTDSGGFQIYSLGDLVQVDDDGLTVKSHLDGATLRLDAESAMDIQHRLGSDIVMAFDQCVPYPAPAGDVAKAVERTTAWARRCRKRHASLGSDAALFGIVQGGMNAALRRQSCEELRSLSFPGYAVGGLSVGEGKELMHEVLAATLPHLPEDAPRYLMGVGPPDDIVNAVAAGVDMFDCVMPTRNARNATVFTRQGILKTRNAGLRSDDGPLDPACSCSVCRRFSRAYIRHLFNAHEMLGPMLASMHNVAYYQDLMAGMRAAIEGGRFDAFRREILSVYGGVT